MAQTDRMFSSEDTMKMLQEKSAAMGNEFTLKVLRRDHMGSVPVLVASMSGAQVEHFANSELWVPPLLGGGNISLQGYHTSDLSKPVGGFIQIKISSPPKDVDTAAISKPEWRGPPVLDFPQKESKREEDSMYGIRPPPGHGSGDNATRSTNAWAMSPGGGFERKDYNGNGAEVSSWAAHQRSQALLENERRKIEEERLANAAQRHRDELESLKKSHEADMRALKMEMLGAIQSSKPTGPDASSTLMMEMVKQAAEDRRVAEVQRAEDRRAQLAAQERADARFAAMLEKLSDRPKDDPLGMIAKVAEILKVNDKGNSNDAQMKMMHQMAEMSGQQVATAMDFVQAAADLQLGQQGEKEPTWMKGLDRLMKGVGAMAKGGLIGRPPQVIPQLQAPPPPPPTYEQQARQVQPGSTAQPVPPPQPTPSVIVQLEDAIRTKVDIATVAEALIKHFGDPSVQSALAEPDVAGDFEKLIYKRLGNWHNENPKNAEYLQALMAEIEKRLTAAGFVESDDDEEGEGDDDQADEGDDE